MCSGLKSREWEQVAQEHQSLGRKIQGYLENGIQTPMA